MSESSSNEWTVLPLGDVATLQRGFDLPVKQREVGEIPIFAANGPVGTHNEAKVRGPGVVTGRSGTIGKVHYIERDYWPLNTSLFVKDFHGNHPKFIFYLLRNMRLERFHEGTGVPTLNRNNVHVVDVSLPPLPEQKRIAEILDKADNIRHKRQEAISFAQDELLPSTFRSRLGDPQSNPHGWPKEKLGDVITFIGGSQPPKSTFVNEPRKGYVRLVQIRDFKSNKYPTYIPADLAKRPFKKDDVMIAR